MVERRLDSQERAEIQVGNIYVWEERGALDLSGMGIERWYVRLPLIFPQTHIVVGLMGFAGDQVV